MTPTYLATLRERIATLESDDLPAQAAEVERIVRELEGMGSECARGVEAAAEAVRGVRVHAQDTDFDVGVEHMRERALEAIRALAAPPPAPELPAEVAAAVKLAAELLKARRLSVEQLELTERFGLTAGDAWPWEPTPLGRALLERARSLR